MQTLSLSCFLAGPRQVRRRPVQHPRPAPGPERQADQEDRLQDPQRRLDGALHQQGLHEEEALLEAGHQVCHTFPGGFGYSTTTGFVWNCEKE